MDELPNIHWRAHEPPPREAGPTRMTILDLMLLTACAAGGMGLARLAYGEQGRREISSDFVSILLSTVWPSLFGALIAGHPLLLAMHSLTGRRRLQGMTPGEGFGCVPILSLLFAGGAGVLCWLGEEVFGDGALIAIFAISAVVSLLMILGVSVFSTFYAIAALGRGGFENWTDALGTATGMFFGASFLLMLFLPYL